jgi:hypothetical protein
MCEAVQLVLMHTDSPEVFDTLYNDQADICDQFIDRFKCPIFRQNAAIAYHGENSYVIPYLNLDCHRPAEIPLWDK